MKAQKPCLIAAIVCLLVLFVSGFAYAETLGEITAEFCAEVQDDAIDAVGELADGAGDLGECIEEYADCRDGRGIFGEDSLPDCLEEGLRCTKFANRDTFQACEEFTSEFGRAYERAWRQATRSDVENEFQLWLHSPASDECLQPAERIAGVCAGVL